MEEVQELVLVPFQTQGHMNPMMQLAHKLIHEGFFIHFVTTSFNYERLDTQFKNMENLQMVVFDDGLPPNDPHTDICRLFDMTETIMVEFLEHLITELKDAKKGVGIGMIMDTLACKAMPIAHNYSIPCAILWTSMTSVFALLCNVPHLLSSKQIPSNGVWPNKEKMMVTTSVPSMSTLSSSLLPWTSGLDQTRQEFIFKFINGYMEFAPKSQWEFAPKSQWEFAPKSQWVLCNSIYELEQPVFEYLSSIGISAFPIGPLQLISPSSSCYGLSNKDVGCLKWLDLQESVIFVSFGSLALMSERQLQEFAVGLEGSGLPFLWVIRDDVVLDDGGRLIDKMKERDGCKERGCLVTWCPQVEVLAHPSVKCFVTHCGWNSVMESIVMGVPMVCLPAFGDQYINCHYVVDVWKVGLRLTDHGAGGIVKSEVIKCVVEKVVCQVEGLELKKNIVDIKRSMKDQRSSSANFKAFVDSMKRNKK